MILKNEERIYHNDLNFSVPPNWYQNKCFLKNDRLADAKNKISISSMRKAKNKTSNCKSETINFEVPWFL
jgi:hypothetical protein